MWDLQFLDSKEVKTGRNKILLKPYLTEFEV